MSREVAERRADFENEECKGKDELEQIDILVVLVDALELRRILQLVVPSKDARRLLVHPRLRLAKELDELRLGEDLAKRFRVAKDRGADGFQLGRARSPAAAAEEGFPAGLEEGGRGGKRLVEGGKGEGRRLDAPESGRSRGRKDPCDRYGKWRR